MYVALRTNWVLSYWKTVFSVVRTRTGRQYVVVHDHACVHSGSIIPHTLNVEGQLFFLVELEVML